MKEEEGEWGGGERGREGGEMGGRRCSRGRLGRGEVGLRTRMGDEPRERMGLGGEEEREERGGERERRVGEEV